MRYNAGSEVYSQRLCQGLAKHQHDVCVFTREENPFAPDYSRKIESDHADSNIRLYVINIPSDRYRYRYRHPEVDKQFGDLLREVRPDIIHIGHLNHLSTSLVYEGHQYNIPMVFTLHDYWLMCPRGQFIQQSGANKDSLWPVCEGQENRKCATHCYSGCTSGATNTWHQQINYWEAWVNERMQHIREIVGLVDCFIAPSRYLYNRFVTDFKLPEEKMVYLDYGFDLNRFAKPVQRVKEALFTFGYIGTHIPAKGIQLLIAAFRLIKEECQLRIWGRANQHTMSLQSIIHSLPRSVQHRIEWMGEYQNSHIIEDVFNKTDSIVVPSIWVENSPLVIHEALQARIPVITADVGGMAEYIHHEVNGLLFKHRDAQSLATQMQRLLANPALVAQLSAAGYLQSADRRIPNMPAHIHQIEKIYQTLLSKRMAA